MKRTFGVVGFYDGVSGRWKKVNASRSSFFGFFINNIHIRGSCYHSMETSVGNAAAAVDFFLFFFFFCLVFLFLLRTFCFFPT